VLLVDCALLLDPETIRTRGSIGPRSLLSIREQFALGPRSASHPGDEAGADCAMAVNGRCTLHVRACARIAVRSPRKLSSCRRVHPMGAPG
jgi:hypothetical protein